MGNCNKKTSSKTLFIKQFSAVSSLMTNITTTLSGALVSLIETQILVLQILLKVEVQI